MTPTRPDPALDPVAEQLRITPFWWRETWFCLVMWLAAAVVTSVGVPVWGWSPWWLILAGVAALAVAELARQLLGAAWLARNADCILTVLDGEGSEHR